MRTGKQLGQKKTERFSQACRRKNAFCPFCLQESLQKLRDTVTEKTQKLAQLKIKNDFQATCNMN